MKKQIAQVKKFHKIFNLRIKTTPQASLGHSGNVLRYNLMKEENEEYLEAAQNNNLVEVADALGDMLYVLCGTMLEHGLQDKMEQVFNEIHSSNLSKLDSFGKPIFREDGKVIKGPNFFKPNIQKILETDFK